jgi:hypothetical protein
MTQYAPRFTGNVTKIQSLPDTPTIPAQELKEAFDMGGSDLGDYINQDLLPFVDAMYENLSNDQKGNIRRVTTSTGGNAFIWI